MDNITELIERLSNDEDAVKKMAVFKLQTNIGDPSFAEAFIAQGGLTKLRRLALTANGNTLAYSLTSLSRLLELDKGWEAVSTELITRVCWYEERLRRRKVLTDIGGRIDRYTPAR